MLIEQKGRCMKFRTKKELQEFAAAIGMREDETDAQIKIVIHKAEDKKDNNTNGESVN